jgi:DNA-binding response OmpR family regulator
VGADSVLEIMREKGIETPVIFLTGEDSEASEIRALERGAVDYLHKPVSRPLLLARVAGVLKNA